MTQKIQLPRIVVIDVDGNVWDGYHDITSWDLAPDRLDLQDATVHPILGDSLRVIHAANLAQCEDISMEPDAAVPDAARRHFAWAIVSPRTILPMIDQRPLKTA